MKGIVLAGGSGTRLYPITKGVSKRVSRTVPMILGNFYAVPADNRDLNYDKYFKEGDKREPL